tara:strand:+ start:51 stop:746 length:696 start_codon:yes stop_codon:yes gene_type:complete
MKQFILLLLGSILFIPNRTQAQVDSNDLGAWYMYVYNASFNESQWGIQGDFQHRNFNILGDLQQILLRSGITYKPKNSSLKLVVGFANITTGTPGESKATVVENRIYQETSFPIKLGKRIYTNHRFRYELRYIDRQNPRTRYRYNLFLNIPLKGEVIVPKTPYLAFYNELFINGQRNIGNNQLVDFFDRNRLYGALGYSINESLKMQLGIMRQTTNIDGKNQLQLSFHHSL